MANPTRMNGAERRVVLDIPPLLQMSLEEAAQAIFAGAATQSIIGLASIRPSRARPTPYLHWHAPLPIARLHQLREIADSIEGRRYWFLQLFSPSCLGRGSGGKPPEWSGSPIFFSPKTAALSELCSIVVDLDVGRDGGERSGANLTADEAIVRLRQLVAGGSLPWPSLIAESGRGVYLIYLLAANYQGRRTPVPNDAQAQKQWRRIASALAKVTADLACDEKSTATPAHAFKAPGKDSDPATYCAVATDVTNIRYWTLDDLEVGLPVAEMKPAPNSRPSTRRRAPSGKFDPARPEKRRLKELAQLAAHRGGISEGHRHNFLLCYTTDLRRLLRKQGAPASVALQRAMDEARKINATFPVPLEDYEVLSLWRADASIKLRHTNVTVARLLDVTEAEVLALGLRSTVPHRLAAQREAKKNAQRAKRRAGRTALNELIQAGFTTAEIIAKTGYGKSTICARRKQLAIAITKK
jgi:hypothetical protein